MLRGGGIRERGEMRRDELDDVVLQKELEIPKAKSMGEIIMEQAKEDGVGGEQTKTETTTEAATETPSVADEEGN